MLKDITLGQYCSADSCIHRLDPRVKIRFVIVYIIMLLIDRNLYLFGILTAVFLISVLLSRVNFRMIVKGTRGIFIFILLCSAVNIVTTAGQVLYHVGRLSVTLEGIIKFGFIFWRMMLIILMSSMLMYTTTPSELTDGLEKCFHLSGGVAMGITIALRFVSVLSGELDRILKAQYARGVDFKSGSPKARIKKIGNVIVPLFQNAIDRAGRLGDAMDARCYMGGKGRTKLNPLIYDVNDVIGYVVLLAVTVSSIWLAVKF
ncbi:MAG: energy-coupling factor transporter transmembrane protein EcfT [Clostridium sp.]|nr:energy-coupling factor transporter transmembrane protein EcfT [Clostridium sp.]MCM1209831.1 energy-coupling factor transporter transmembrane protein EcfT [Ruminococcus sp.]